MNRIIDRISEFLAIRKGMLPMLGIVLILINLILQFIPSVGWLAQSDLLLHVGVVTAILGIMIAWAL